MAKPPKAPNLASQVPGSGWDFTMNQAGQVQPGAAPASPVAPLGSAQTVSSTGQIGTTQTAPLLTPEGLAAYNRQAGVASGSALGSKGVSQEAWARAHPEYTTTGAYQAQVNATGGTGGGQASLAAQGSQFGQQAAMDALNNIRGFTGTGLTGAERDAMNAAIQRGTAQSQAAIRSLAQQAAARGAMDSGGMWAAQGAAAQSGGNAAAGLGADMGLAAQNRAMGANQALFGMGQSINAQAMQAGGAQDAMNMGLTGMGISAGSQDFQNRLAAYNASQQNSPWNQFMRAFGGGLDFAQGMYSASRQGNGGNR